MALQVYWPARLLLMAVTVRVLVTEFSPRDESILIPAQPTRKG
jgi:hypothetical protein